MKVRLNKKTLSEMPEAVRAIVSDWKTHYGKAFISVENRTSFFVGEDSRVTLLNLIDGSAASAQAAGDFAGMTQLSPNAQIPLVPGVVAIEQGFFCGLPYLNLFQGCPKQIEVGV